jgi:hypothetical protein
VCHPPTDPTKNVCLTDAVRTCANDDIISQTNNAAIKGFVCNPVPLDTASTCKPIADGGSALCTEGPISAQSYGNIKIAPTVKAEDAFTPIVPTLGIDIPGLRFSSAERTSQQGVEGRYIRLPFLGEYIAGIYKYLLAISVIVATIMIVYGGFLYIISSSLSSVKNGKTIIFNALIGLGILFGSTTILGTVNPDLINLRMLSVLEVETAKDQYLIDEFGTGNANASADDLNRAFNPNMEGFAPPLVTTNGRVDISGISIDESAGGPANLAKFCSRSADITAAETPDQKRDLLARAVLGFKKVCIDNKLCAYCQGGGTSVPGGGVRCATQNGRYAGATLIDNGFFTPEGLWGANQACLDAWNNPAQQNQLVSSEACKAISVPLYNQVMSRSIEKAKMAAYDCGGAVFSMYNCAGQSNHKKAQFKDKKTNQLVGYPNESAVLDDPNRTDSILFNVPFNQAAGALARKGGIQFGDLVHVCCGKGYSSHWFMYTGGRSDVPFSFIEMGGTGNGTKLAVPFADQGGSFSLSGMQTKPSSWTLGTYLEALIKTGWDPSKGRIWVWRPYAE